MDDDDLRRFQANAEAYGAQRHRWPPRDRALFDALSATPEGASGLAQAGRVDDFLDGLETADGPSPDLLRRIATQADPPAAVRTRRRLPRWLPAGGLALGLAMGFALGFSRADPHDAGLEALGRFLIDPSGAAAGGGGL